jgi:hypothetical protein
MVRTVRAPATGVVVWVSDDLGYAGGLAQYLPMNWTTRPLADPSEVDAADAEVGLLVLAAADAGTVAAARRRLPADAHIVAVIDPVAPVDTLVDVLQAGADSCVRGGSSQILAGHVRACERRRTHNGPALSGKSPR